jgi:hypothetical protein
LLREVKQAGLATRVVFLAESLEEGELPAAIRPDGSRHRSQGRRASSSRTVRSQGSRRRCLAAWDPALAPKDRPALAGGGALTSREIEIARLLCRNLSNRADRSAGRYRRSHRQDPPAPALRETETPGSSAAQPLRPAEGIGVTTVGEVPTKLIHEYMPDPCS